VLAFIAVANVERKRAGNGRLEADETALAGYVHVSGDLATATQGGVFQWR
jgi:hypothetical protein